MLLENRAVIHCHNIIDQGPTTATFHDFKLKLDLLYTQESLFTVIISIKCSGQSLIKLLDDVKNTSTWNIEITWH